VALPVAKPYPVPVPQPVPVPVAKSYPAPIPQPVPVPAPGITLAKPLVDPVPYDYGYHHWTTRKLHGPGNKNVRQ
jgi:hypothetical protein